MAGLTGVQSKPCSISEESVCECEGPAREPLVCRVDCHQWRPRRGILGGCCSYRLSLAGDDAIGQVIVDRGPVNDVVTGRSTAACIVGLDGCLVLPIRVGVADESLREIGVSVAQKLPEWICGAGVKYTARII